MARQFNKDNSEEDFTPRRDSRKKSDTGKKRSFSSGNRKRNYSEDNDSEDSDREYRKKRYPKEDGGNRKYDRKPSRARKFDRGDDGEERPRKFSRDDNRGKGRDRKFRKDEDKPRKRDVVAELTAFDRREAAESRQRAHPRGSSRLW